jgi:dTDP-4-dehydrorhamnose 3,5-epimerase
LIEGVRVRELPSSLDKEGLTVEIWGGEDRPSALQSSSCRVLFPGIVEAWMKREAATERIICLEGTIKLVLCDRREGSSTREEVMELFLGEYRFREVSVPPGVLRGWKAVGGHTALVFLALEGGEGESRVLTPMDAQVPYDWEIVMQ